MLLAPHIFISFQYFRFGAKFKDLQIMALKDSYKETVD